MRKIAACVAAVLLASSAAFADPKVTYVPRLDLRLSPKSAEASIDILDAAPGRANGVLGVLVMSGDPDSPHQQLIDLALARARELGADYVWIAKMDATQRTSSTPGFGIFIPFIGGHIGGSRDTKDVPHLQAAIGVYAKATLGVIYDEEKRKQRKLVVAAFRSTSKAQDAGLRIGDEIIEYDGHLPSDPKFQRTMLSSYEPGQVMKVHVRRGAETLTVDVPMVTND